MTLPAAYANTPSAVPTSTAGMIARPSRPSVKFTPLLAHDDHERREHDVADRAERDADAGNVRNSSACSTGGFSAVT